MSFLKATAYIVKIVKNTVAGSFAKKKLPNESDNECATLKYAHYRLGAQKRLFLGHKSRRVYVENFPRRNIGVIARIFSNFFDIWIGGRVIWTSLGPRAKYSVSVVALLGPF